MPAGGDLRLYQGARDWGTQGDARRSMYDLCRDSHMSHDQAKHYAELGSAKLVRDQAGEVVTTAPVTMAERHGAAGRRSRFRVAFPWEAEPVSPDGTTSP